VTRSKSMKLYIGFQGGVSFTLPVRLPEAFFWGIVSLPRKMKGGKAHWDRYQ
jgi:hypothetical protein